MITPSFRSTSLPTRIAAALLLASAGGSLLAQTPANDAFANRIEIPGSVALVTASNVGATREAGEPNHVGHQVGASVWYSWMAPDSGRVTIDTTGSSFDTVLGIYTGFAVDQLAMVAENDDNAGESTSGVQFEAVAGTYYQIAVDGFQGDSGNFKLNVNLPVPPTLPEFRELPSGASVIEGTITNITFRAQAIGTLPLHFQWQFQGIDILGATGPSLTITNPVAANEGTYRVIVTNVAGFIPSPPVVLVVRSTVANDAFANRIPLSGVIAEAHGHNATATPEPGDPLPLAVPGGKSVWWSWTAPATGLVRISTAGSSFDTLLGVYAGSTLGALSPLAENDDQGEGSTSTVWIRAQAGTTYQILVDGFKDEFGAIASGDIFLTVFQEADNDSFENRLWIVGNVASIHEDNTGATLQALEPVHSAIQAGHTVWWTWNADESGPVSIDTLGSSIPTILAVYTGSELASLVPVGHDEVPGSSSRVRFLAVAGTRYQILLDGQTGAGTGQGSMVLNLSQVATGNDDFEGRIPLRGSTNVVTATSVGASKQPGEPNHAGNRGGRSIWWSWIAPHSGAVSIATTNSSFDTVLGIYTGSRVDALTLVAQNDDFEPLLQSLVRFEAVEGTEYAIAVDGFGSETEIAAGTVILTVEQVAPIAPRTNDRFADRALIEGQQATVTASNLTATKEPGEPEHSGNRGGRSLWWSWVAPANDPVTIDTIGSSFDTIMGVYTGGNVAELTLVESDDDSAGERKSTVTFLPVAGVEYQIAVDGYLDGTDQAAGQVVVNLIQYPPGPQIANDDFANRTPILPQFQSIRGSNIGATRQSGEPAHLGSAVGGSVWWSWVASANGPVTIDTIGSGFDTVLSVYIGSSLDELELVVDNDDIGGGSNKSRVRFQAQAGIEYQLAVEGYASKIGAISLNILQESDVAGAPQVTQQPRSQTRFQNGAGGGTNVSFNVVVIGSLPLTYQWQRDGENLPGATRPVLTVTNATAANAGSYRVVVANDSGSVTSAPAVLSIVSAPFNDQFASRIAVAGQSARLLGSNLEATKEPGEPNHAGNLGGRSVWWSWIAPSNGPVSIDTYGSSFDTGLAIYEGTSIQSLSLVAENDDLLPGQQNNSFVRFAAVAGREYQIAVDAFKTNGASGSIVVNLHQPPQPPMLVSQAGSLDLMAGATLTLEVTGTGVTPLYQYQWYLNDAPIAGATGRSLVIANVTAAERGRYHVVATNEFGTAQGEATDVWVRLRQPVAQVLRSSRLGADGRFQFSFSDADGNTLQDPGSFEVQSTAKLEGSGTVWLPRAGSITLKDGQLTFEDAVGSVGTHRIYRVREK